MRRRAVILAVVVALGMLFGSGSKANAGLFNCCKPKCYTPCYSYCYTPCYYYCYTPCYTPCYYYTCYTPCYYYPCR